MTSGGREMDVGGAVPNYKYGRSLVPGAEEERLVHTDELPVN